jgi:iron complex transport system ATP-binding protein
LNLALYPGQFVCLIGPNGAGKSTLLRTLAGLQAPLGGHLELNEQPMARLSQAQRARLLSIVMTQRPEVGQMRGYELVSLGRHPYSDWLGGLSPHDHRVIQWAIQTVGAEKLAPRLLDEVSDGERQKLMVARALAQETPLIIMDEPTAFLDLPRRVELMHLLRQLAHQTAKAILLSTHDLELALRTANSLWLMTAEGQVHMGGPEDMVITGALGRAFHSEGLHFDPLQGAFRLRQAAQGRVAVIGQGLAWAWTCRAIERIGLAIEGDATPEVATIQVADGPLWHFKQQVYLSIDDLVSALTQEFPHG